MKRILLFSLTVLVFASGCREFSGRRIRGNGDISTESRSATSFNSLRVSGAINVYLSQDSSYSIKVEADRNLLEYVDVVNEGGTLYIEEAEGVNLRPSRSIKVYLSAPDFKRIKASGACDIYSDGKVTGSESISIDLSGACNVKMDINAPSVNVELSGAGKIDLRGETKDFKVRGSGSTDIRCFDLLAENVEVRITGAGDADLYASVKLEAKVSGAGSVRYKGNAQVSQSVSGAGSVKKVD